MLVEDDLDAIEERYRCCLPDDADVFTLASSVGDVSTLLTEVRRLRLVADAKPTVIDTVMAELERATVKFPTWPTDPLHALGVVHEEVGELSKEVLQLVYEPHKTSAAKVREEAIQAAAMALRFAMSLDLYEYAPGQQHSQREATHGG